jgi:rhodanese-related sulfurtransferase
LKENILHRRSEVSIKMTDDKSLKKFLVLVAIILAILAVVAGSPHKITIQPISITEEIDIDGKLVGVIDVQELAKWILDKKDDYYLIDLRSKNMFDEYHIPFALSISAEELQIISVNKKATIIIYDKSSRYSIKHIESLINSRQEQIYLLRGGMNEWISKILFPDLRENDDLSEDDIEKIYKTSMYFGGKPIFDKERPKRKYKREGC